MQMLRCTRDTALLQPEDHHQGHEQLLGGDRCGPTGSNVPTTASSTTRSSGIPLLQARASHRAAPTWGNGLCASQGQPGAALYRMVPCVL
ncbi:hypothetical protein [Streptomyces syringium]|uniref:hypothetical protein n=1 Tax=Streptomyces syringium TaxID=76729 RepID=UPI003403E447